MLKDRLLLKPGRVISVAYLNVISSNRLTEGGQKPHTTIINKCYGGGVNRTGTMNHLVIHDYVHTKEL